MELHRNTDFQNHHGDSNLSVLDERPIEETRIIADPKAAWRRTKILVTVLEIALWICAIAFSFGLVSIYRMTP